MKSSRSVGLLLLGIYLILVGLTSLFGLSFKGIALLMGLLALLAGVLLLAGR